MMIAPEILQHYAPGQEEHRLRRSLGRLEWLRTMDILKRYLPLPPARILDVGGGTGVYALPLAARGYELHLIDPVPGHVARAEELSASAAFPLTSARVGHARQLDLASGSVDVVLLLGPLYHLIDRAERVAALAECRRVLVTGGLLVTAYISRFAPACDGIQEGKLRDEAFARMVHHDLRDGIHRNPTDNPAWFTTAYFHHPNEIAPEIAEAGLELNNVLAVEGPGWVSPDLDEWLDDEPARERLLEVLRQIESEPTLLGASAHLLAVSKNPES